MGYLPTGGGGGGVAIGDTITSATAGSAFFAGASGVMAQDNAGFFYDDATNQLRLTASAATQTPLQINLASAQSGNAFEVKNSGGTALTYMPGAAFGGFRFYNANSAHTAEIYAANYNGLWLGSTDNQVVIGNSGYSPSTQTVTFNTATSGTTPNALIVSQAVGKPGLVVKLAASQTADAFQVTDSASTVLASITSNGYVNTSRVEGSGNLILSSDASNGNIYFYGGQGGQPASISYYDHINLAIPAFPTSGTFYSQITSNQNDYPITIYAGALLRLSTDASRDITGFAVSGGNWDGAFRMVINVGSNNLVLKHESASSTAANRLLNSTGADITLAANQAADLFYDSTTARWRVFKRN